MDAPGDPARCAIMRPRRDPDPLDDQDPDPTAPDADAWVAALVLLAVPGQLDPGVYGALARAIVGVLAGAPRPPSDGAPHA